jgi:hypothetical protein
MAEHGQVPHVLDLFAAGVGDGPANVRGLRPQQRPCGLPGTLSASHAAIDATCWRRSASQTARSDTSVALASLRVRCCMPNSTSTTSSTVSPRKLICPPSQTAGQVSRQWRSSTSGSVVTVFRHRT